MQFIHTFQHILKKQYTHFTEAAVSLTCSLKPANELDVQLNILLI